MKRQQGVAVPPRLDIFSVTTPFPAQWLLTFDYQLKRRMNLTTETSPDVFDFNYTYDDYYGMEDTPHHGTEPHALHIASIAIYSLAFLLGVPGNAIVIWFTGFKWEKTVSMLWFLNLAIADLIFVLFLPLHITYVAMEFNWLFGKILCKVSSFIAFLNMFASVFFLTVICFDRFVFLACPSFSHKHRTLAKAGMVSGIVWICATFIASPALYYRDTLEIGESTTICFNNFHESDHSVKLKIHMSMTLIRLFIGYLFPMLSMIICYTILAIRLRMQNKKGNSKFFWMVFAIVVAFFICWTPYHIFSLLELTVHHSDVYNEWIRLGIPVSTSIVFVNSCINPILYVLISKVYRTHLEASVAEIFKHTIRDISQTTIKSDQLMDSENNATECETVS